MGNLTDHKSHGSGLTDMKKLHKRVVYILDDLFFLSPMVILYTVSCVYLMQPPNANTVSGNVSPLLPLHISYKYVRTI